MSIAPPGNDGNDAGYADLGALLDRPLHTIELEDGEGQRDLRRAAQRCELSLTVCLYAKRELHAIVGDRGYSSAANCRRGCNVELLPDFGAEHASKMSGMLADQRGGILQILRRRSNGGVS